MCFTFSKAVYVVLCFPFSVAWSSFMCCLLQLALLSSDSMIKIVLVLEYVLRVYSSVW